MNMKLLKSIILLLFLLLNVPTVNAYTIDSIEGRIVEMGDNNCKLEFNINYNLNYYEKTLLQFNLFSETNILENEFENLDVDIESVNNGVASGILYDYADKIGDVYDTQPYTFDNKINIIKIIFPDGYIFKISGEDYIPQIRHTYATDDGEFYSPEVNDWIVGNYIGSTGLPDIPNLGVIDYHEKVQLNSYENSWSDTFEIEPATDVIEIQIDHIFSDWERNKIPTWLDVIVMSPTGKEYRATHINFDFLKKTSPSTTTINGYLSTEGLLISNPEGGKWNIEVILSNTDRVVDVYVDIENLDLEQDANAPRWEGYKDVYSKDKYNFIGDLKSNREMYHKIESFQFPSMTVKGEAVYDVYRDIAYIIVKKDENKDNKYNLIITPAFGIVHPHTNPTTIDKYFKGSDFGPNGFVTIGYREGELYDVYDDLLQNELGIQKSDFEVMFQSGDEKYPVDEIHLKSEMNEDVVGLLDFDEVAVGALSYTIEHAKVPDALVGRTPAIGLAYSLGKLWAKDTNARTNWQYPFSERSNPITKHALMSDNGYDQIEIYWLPQDERPIGFGDSIIVPINLGMNKNNDTAFYVYAKIKFANKQVYLRDPGGFYKDNFPQSYYESIELRVRLDESGNVKDIEKIL